MFECDNYFCPNNGRDGYCYNEKEYWECGEQFCTSDAPERKDDFWEEGE